MWSPFLRRQEPKQFWDWFQAHLADLEVLIARHRGAKQIDIEDFERRTEPLLLELRRYDRRLAFELGGRANAHEIVITAEGDTAAFDVVFALVAAAPFFPGWRVIPLKPRTPHVHVNLNLGTHVISTKGFRFVHSPIGDGSGKVDLLLLAEMEESTFVSSIDALQGAGQLLVQAHLGEFDASTLVNSIAVIRLSRFKEQTGEEGRPIEELQEVFPPSPPN